jgi:hypothetical protein
VTSAVQLISNIVSFFVGLTNFGHSSKLELLSYAPRPKVDYGYLEREKDIDSIARKGRALNLLPGTSILIGNEQIIGHDIGLIEGRRDYGLQLNHNSVDMYINSDGIRLYR